MLIINFYAIMKLYLFRSLSISTTVSVYLSYNSLFHKSPVLANAFINLYIITQF